MSLLGSPCAMNERRGNDGKASDGTLARSDGSRRHVGDSGERRLEITLRIIDNIPDRNSPWGTVIDTINKEFMRQHGNVKIVVESLPDQPYQEKMKIYAASNKLPDVFKYWSFSTLLGELVNNKLALALNPKDYTKFNFVPGSLESNMYNGKLYGLPVTMDYWVVYYNKALFEKCNVKVPATIEDMKRPPRSSGPTASCPSAPTARTPGRSASPWTT